MSPMPKRVFAFRYIESLGQENHGCPADKPFENFRLPDGKIGCPGPSECRIFEA